jgi:hypothetical protein
VTLKGSSADWPQLSSSAVLGTCKPITKDTQIDQLIQHYENGIAYEAMTNYPYSSNFLNP